jgi:putative transposase
MPRQARLDIPGALHHIMVRGINKADIFDDEQDKTQFLERLVDNCQDIVDRFYCQDIVDSHRDCVEIIAADS